MTRRKTFIEDAEALHRAQHRAQTSAADYIANSSPLTRERIIELGENYRHYTLRRNRSDLFGTDDERVELCRLALAALQRSVIYKNPACTIDHPGQSCNVACGY
jgi:hypothetical protein